MQDSELCIEKLDSLQKEIFNILIENKQASSNKKELYSKCFVCLSKIVGDIENNNFDELNFVGNETGVNYAAPKVEFEFSELIMNLLELAYSSNIKLSKTFMESFKNLRVRK